MGQFFAESKCRSGALIVRMRGIMPRTTMTSLLLAASLCLVGCAPQSNQLVEAPHDPGTIAAKNYSPDSPETTGGEQGSGQQTAGQTHTGQQHRFVEDRVFQLDKLQKATIRVDKNTFHLWVMDNDSKRSEGMMFLKKEDFKDDEGMIFVFPNEGSEPRRFWMRNTLVDLDICYCDKDGMINSVYTMKALDETTDYSSKRPSMYVIELRDGTLKKLGIRPGMRFIIPEDVVAKD